jgi:hypothetical protein
MVLNTNSHFPKGGVVMQRLFNFLMVGLTFAVLNVGTAAAQAEVNPL